MRGGPIITFFGFFFSWPTKKKKLSHASDSSPNQLHFTTSNELCGFETRHRLGKKKKRNKRNKNATAWEGGEVFFVVLGGNGSFSRFVVRNVQFCITEVLRYYYYILGRVIRYAATISRQIFPFVTHA